MTDDRIALDRGRVLFGSDPENYDAARPDYPESIYARLRARCGLAPGCRTLEIGAGTGTATRRLLALGAELVALEPDARLAAFLRANVGNAADVRTVAFEDAELPTGGFDLVVAATSFHWLEQASALAKAARVLRPDGWIALFWHVFGDETRPDPFHDATADLLRPARASPASERPDAPAFGLDTSARMDDLRAAGCFCNAEHHLVRWTGVLGPAPQLRALYATFSPIAELEPDTRVRVLDELARIAREQFGGRVERPFVTSLYTARRLPAGVSAADEPQGE